MGRGVYFDKEFFAKIKKIYNLPDNLNFIRISRSSIPYSEEEFLIQWLAKYRNNVGFLMIELNPFLRKGNYGFFQNIVSNTSIKSNRQEYNMNYQDPEPVLSG
ncbi:hypothetical protein FRA_33c05670 [Francisella sp. W12-1067]|nr:hypothetical protein FRA_33c05670 [Francisella sp. W12-1067]